MATARVFKSGNSQALRLPKAFRFESNVVEIFRRGDEVVLRERRDSAAEQLIDAFDKVPAMPADVFGTERSDAPAQAREGL